MFCYLTDLPDIPLPGRRCSGVGLTLPGKNVIVYKSLISSTGWFLPGQRTGRDGVSVDQW
jgi:hypothetical protein